jgi:anti-sigma B factor antagonist
VLTGQNAARHCPINAGVLAVSDECELEVPVPAAAAGSRLPLIITLPGEIDVANAAVVRADLAAAVARGAATVIADMSMTSFCDCAGVSALLGAGRRAACLGSEFRIVAAARPVLRVFELTGLDTALPVYPSTLAAAGRGLTVPPPGGRQSTVIWLSRRRGTGSAGSVPRPGQPRFP